MHTQQPLLSTFIFLLWQTFFADPFVQEHVRLDAVVCLCDSPRLLRTLVAPPPPPPPPLARASTSVVASTTDGASAEGSSAAGPAAAAAATLVMSQLALSDRVLLNKSDLITPAEVSSAPPATALFTGWLADAFTRYSSGVWPIGVCRTYRKCHVCFSPFFPAPGMCHTYRGTIASRSRVASQVCDDITRSRCSLQVLRRCFSRECVPSLDLLSIVPGWWHA